MSWSTFRHEAMATYFEIAVASTDPEYARQATAAAFREIDRLEAELSRFMETSDVARANRLRPNETIAIGDALLECLLLATDISLATAGAFDVTFASTGNARHAHPYSLDPDNHTLTAHVDGLRLDLGAIGKGYALDVAADLLGEWQIGQACLVAGGSTVVALDPPPSAEGWTIGVGDEPNVRPISLRGVSISASGTAVKGAHLIDPRTRQPAARQARVWALGSSGAQSDALSTAFFVMGDAAIAAFCEQHPNLGAAVTDASGNLLPLGALRQFL